MSKIRRNDPCPCGSGKKYKKCCGRNENKINMNAVNNELYHIHQELISFATTTFDNQLDKQLKLFESPSIQDKETMEVYQTGLIPWIISAVPCLKNHETMLKRLYRSRQGKLSIHARDIFVRWLHAKPSVYEIISIDSPKKQFLYVKELGTEKTFYIPFQHADDFLEGSLLVGIVIPFVGHHNFLFTMVKLYQRDKQNYMELIKDYSVENEGLAKSFPKFLATALSSESIENKWDTPVHEEVAHLFSEHMANKDMNDRAIIEGISIWNSFCEQEKPTIKKIEPYAAAIDYYVQKVTLNNTRVKQAEVAKEYETSSSTLSNIYRRIKETV